MIEVAAPGSRAPGVRRTHTDIACAAGFESLARDQRRAAARGGEWNVCDEIEVLDRKRASAAGLTEVPCVVRVLDDATALEIALVENSQRNDPSPLEEAESIDLLTRKHGRTVDQVADKLGRDVRWVRRRLTLLTLCEAARERMRKGELPLAHAERVTDLVCPREFGPEASHG